jgi:hypothetical protein
MVKNIIVLCLVAASFAYKASTKNNEGLIVKNAAMPCVAKDAHGALHIVFTKGNRLEYITSGNNGITFSSPVLIDTINGLFGVAGRGPQIISTPHTLIIFALDMAGNIYAYTKYENDNWIKRGKVNDAADVCKEGFLSVSAKEDSLYAIWLDLRGNSKNKIAGALSADGGKTWSKNKIIYQSPDGSVCECCKPSVAFGKNGINIMFRNNLDGNRDLYLIQSHDSGKSFSAAIKLGEGNWKLNGCPMDGGSIAVTPEGAVETVWRRVDTIFSCTPGEKEKMIGMGKNCIIENIDDKCAYAWIENGNIVCLLPGGKKINLGAGTFPVLKALNKNQLICVWQSDKDIYRKIIRRI